MFDSNHSPIKLNPFLIIVQCVPCVNVQIIWPEAGLISSQKDSCEQNDLFYFHVSRCILCNYADDNTLSKSDKYVKVLEYKLSIASQTAVKWFQDNFMKANAPKFQVAFFSRDKEIESITINLEGVQLHSNECTTLLGVHVDIYLTFIRLDK